LSGSSNFTTFANVFVQLANKRGFKTKQNKKKISTGPPLLLPPQGSHEKVKQTSPKLWDSN
jgi:hypothetical protein